MKINLTYLDVIKLNAEIGVYLKKEGFLDENGYTEKPKTKMLEACKNVLKQTDKIFEKYNEDLELIRIEFALEDEKTKAVLYDVNGNYKYTKENLKKLNVKIKELQKTEVEVHQRLVEDIDNLLEDYETFNNIFSIKTKEE